MQLLTYPSLRVGLEPRLGLGLAVSLGEGEVGGCPESAIDPNLHPMDMWTVFAEVD